MFGYKQKIAKYLNNRYLPTSLKNISNDSIRNDYLFDNDGKLVGNFLKDYSKIVFYHAIAFSFFLIFAFLSLTYSYVYVDTEKSFEFRFLNYVSKISFTLSLIFLTVFIIFNITRSSYIDISSFEIFLGFYFLYIFAIFVYRNYVKVIDTTVLTPQDRRWEFYLYFVSLLISIIGMLIMNTKLRTPLVDLKMCNLKSNLINIVSVIGIFFSISLIIDFLVRDFVPIL